MHQTGGMCTPWHHHKRCMGTDNIPAKFGGMHGTQSQPNAMHAQLCLPAPGLLLANCGTIDWCNTHQIDPSGTPCHSHDCAMVTSNDPAKYDGMQYTQTQPNAMHAQLCLPAPGPLLHHGRMEHAPVT